MSTAKAGYTYFVVITFQSLVGNNQIKKQQLLCDIYLEATVSVLVDSTIKQIVYILHIGPF